MSNLPTTTTHLQAVSRNPEARRNFRAGWGAKTPGIKDGDFLDGIILGFETNEFNSKNIVLKSFMNSGSQVLVFGCSSIQNELHKDQYHTQLLFNAGDVVRITYKGSYVGKKGRSQGKLVAIFSIDELVGYQMTQQDVNEITDFQRMQQQSQIQKSGLNTYQPPQQQPQYQPQNQGYQFQQIPAVNQSQVATPTHLYQQPAQSVSYQQPTPGPRTFSPVSKEPFDVNS